MVSLSVLEKYKKEEKPMAAPGNLEPAAIQFTFECLQKSARQLGNYNLLSLFLFICIPKTLESDLLSLSTPSGTMHAFICTSRYYTKELCLKVEEKYVIRFHRYRN